MTSSPILSMLVDSDTMEWHRLFLTCMTSVSPQPPRPPPPPPLLPVSPFAGPPNSTSPPHVPVETWWGLTPAALLKALCDSEVGPGLASQIPLATSVAGQEPQQDYSGLTSLTPISPPSSRVVGTCRAHVIRLGTSLQVSCSEACCCNSCCLDNPWHAR